MPVSITGSFGTGIVIMYDRNVKTIVMKLGNVFFDYIPDESGIFTYIISGNGFSRSTRKKQHKTRIYNSVHPS
jgi:hypothetical protein